MSLHLPLRDALSPLSSQELLRSVIIIPRQPNSQNSRQSKHNPLTPQISKLWLGRSRQSGASVAALRSRGLSTKCRLHRQPSPQTGVEYNLGGGSDCCCDCDGGKIKSTPSHLALVGARTGV